MSVTIPILIVVAPVMRRAPLAMNIGGTHLMATVAQGWVDSGRAGALLADSTQGRETFAGGSLGHPSGHAVVAGAPTVFRIPHLSAARSRWLPLILVAIAFVGRLYVGARPPLDLIGSAALGVAAGCLATLVVGVPDTVTAVLGRGERAAT